MRNISKQSTSWLLFFILAVFLNGAFAFSVIDPSEWSVDGQGIVTKKISFQDMEYNGNPIKAIKTECTFNAISDARTLFAKFNNTSRPTKVTAPLSVLVYGDNSGGELILRLIDDAGVTFQYTWPEAINWEGWREIVFTDLSPGKSNNPTGQITGDLNFAAIFVSYWQKYDVTSAQLIVGDVSFQRKPLGFDEISWTKIWTDKVNGPGFSLVSDEFHSGNSSVKAVANNNWQRISTGKFPVDANTNYEFSCWIKTASDLPKDGISLDLEMFGAGGANLGRWHGEAKLIKAGGNTQWTKYRLFLGKPSNSGTLEIRVNIRFEKVSQGIAWLDDCYFGPVQVTDIQGRAVDVSAPGRSIPIADLPMTIQIEDYSQKYNLTTDGNGAFLKTNLPAGNYKLMAAYKTGYAPVALSFPVHTANYELVVEMEAGGVLGFEEDTMFLWEDPSPNVNFTLDETTTPNGTVTAKLENLDTTDMWLGTVLLPVSDRYEYQLSGYIKTQGMPEVRGARLPILLADKDGKFLGWWGGTVASLCDVGGTRDWQKYEIDLGKPDPATKYVRVYVRTAWGATGGRAWYDDIAFGPVFDLYQLQINRAAFSPELVDPVEISYDVPFPSLITAKVFNDNGELITTLATDRLATGMDKITWDGKTTQGDLAADGEYTIKVRAISGDKTVERQIAVAIETQSPTAPVLVQPYSTGEVLVHNQSNLALAWQASEASLIEIWRRANGLEEMVASGQPDNEGIFKSSVSLVEQVDLNEFWAVAIDEAGNFSENSSLLKVTYDPNRSYGVVSVENGSLISPKDFNDIKDQLELRTYLTQAGTVKFVVLGKNQTSVYEQQFSSQGSEEVIIPWRGLDHEGNYLPDGFYNYQMLWVTAETEEEIFQGSLEIDNTPPLAPIGLYPVKGAVLTQAKPELRWEKVADAVSYQLVIGQNSDSVGTPAIELTAQSYETTENLAAGKWYWQVRAVDRAGNVSPLAEESLWFEVKVLQDERFGIRNFAMGPNPMTPGTGRREEVILSYTLQREARVNLKVYNMAGNLIWEQDCGMLPAADHSISWDGKDRKGGYVASGLYLLRLVAVRDETGEEAIESRALLIFR